MVDFDAIHGIQKRHQTDPRWEAFVQHLFLLVRGGTTMDEMRRLKGGRRLNPVDIYAAEIAKTAAGLTPAADAPSNPSGDSELDALAGEVAEIRAATEGQVVHQPIPRPDPTNLDGWSAAKPADVQVVGLKGLGPNAVADGVIEPAGQVVATELVGTGDQQAVISLTQYLPEEILNVAAAPALKRLPTTVLQRDGGAPPPIVSAVDRSFAVASWSHFRSFPTVHDAIGVDILPSTLSDLKLSFWYPTRLQRAALRCISLRAPAKSPSGCPAGSC